MFFWKGVVVSFLEFFVFLVSGFCFLIKFMESRFFSGSGVFVDYFFTCSFV